MKTAIFFSIAILMCSVLPTAAEEGGTDRSFEIDSTFATGAHWSVQDGCGILQITLPAIKDDLPLPKPPSIRIWLLQPDGSSTKPSTKGDSPVGVSMRGFTTPSLIYEFQTEAASTAVAVVVQLEGKFLVFSLLPGNNAAEQDGADQPATAPEPKPEGSSKPQPESEERPQ